MKALQLVQPRIFEIVNVPIPELNKDTSERILVKQGGYRYVAVIFLF